MTSIQKRTTAVAVAVLVGLGAGQTEARQDSSTPTRTAVITQAACHGTAPDTRPLPAGLVRAMDAGAHQKVACNTLEATAIVNGLAAEGYDRILGAGPAVRAALEVAKQDFPEVAISTAR